MTTPKKPTKAEVKASFDAQNVPPVNRQAQEALAAFGKGKAVSLTHRSIQGYPIQEKPLIGYYLGIQEMKDKHGNVVISKDKKPWTVHKFLTADTGELVFLPRHGMLNKQLESDTNLGGKVYFVAWKGKSDIGGGQTAHAYDISYVEADKPLDVNTMAATDAAVSEGVDFEKMS